MTDYLSSIKARTFAEWRKEEPHLSDAQCEARWSGGSEAAAADAQGRRAAFEADSRAARRAWALLSPAQKQQAMDKVRASWRDTARDHRWFRR